MGGECGLVVDGHSADFISQPGKPLDINQCGVVHPCVGEVFQCRHCDLRTSEAKGRIDLVLAITWNRYPRVTGKGDEVSLIAFGVQVQNHERTRSGETWIATVVAHQDE